MTTSANIRSTEGLGRTYGSVLDTVGNTPCIRINNLGPKGVRIYVKAEFFNPAGSVKDRLALNIIEAAERDGLLKPALRDPYTADFSGREDDVRRVMPIFASDTFWG